MELQLLSFTIYYSFFVPFFCGIFLLYHSRNDFPLRILSIAFIFTGVAFVILNFGFGMASIHADKLLLPSFFFATSCFSLILLAYPVSLIYPQWIHKYYFVALIPLLIHASLLIIGKIADFEYRDLYSISDILGYANETNVWYRFIQLGISLVYLLTIIIICIIVLRNEEKYRNIILTTLVGTIGIVVFYFISIVFSPVIGKFLKNLWFTLYVGILTYRIIRIKIEEAVNRLVQARPGFLNEQANMSSPKLLIEKVKQILPQTLLTAADEEAFRKSFVSLYPSAFHRLRTTIPGITRSEELFCIFTTLGLEVTEIAQILGIDPKSVIKTRYRLRKKIEKDDNLSMEIFIKELILG